MPPQPQVVEVQPTAELTGLTRYDMKEILGKGHFAKVRRCSDRLTGKEYAVKVIDKKDLLKTAAVVRSEIDILRAVGYHQHCVSLVDHFEGEKEYYIVMEYCAGGDLFSKIVSEGKYSERRAARCCLQLASALKFVHERGVTHRDLKPENILLVDDSLDSDIKVADFGLAKLMKSQQHIMRTVCGTWAYCAPEVISRKPYTQTVDCWTLGVLMFILLSGYHPFDVYGEMPEPQLLKKIKDCEYDFDDEVWDHVSPQAKELIRGLLVVEPEKRMTLDEYLTSAWIRGENVSDRPLNHVVDRLSQFNNSRKKFRALVLAKLAAGRFRASISHSRGSPALSALRVVTGNSPIHSISRNREFDESPGSPPLSPFSGLHDTLDIPGVASARSTGTAPSINTTRDTSPRYASVSATPRDRGDISLSGAVFEFKDNEMTPLEQLREKEREEMRRQAQVFREELAASATASASATRSVSKDDLPALSLQA